MSGMIIDGKGLFRGSDSLKYPGGYLCISKYKFGFNHYFEANDGESKSSFGYIVNGRVELRSQKTNLVLGAGDAFYIPENEKYTSIWTGTPDIEFYGIHSLPALDEMSETGSFTLGKVNLPDSYDAAEAFMEMHSLLRKKETAKRLRAVGIYYEFVSLAFDSLVPKKIESLPEVLREAMDIIKEHNELDISVPELAKKLHVSESTVYHLFSQYLGTTPISYRNELRIERALPLIGSGKTVESTASEVGFNSSVHFRSVFIKFTGMTPNEYRKSQSDKKSK